MSIWIRLFPQNEAVPAWIMQGLCVKYFLSFPQKNLSPDKIETNYVSVYFLIR